MRSAGEYRPAIEQDKENFDTGRNFETHKKNALHFDAKKRHFAQWPGDGTIWAGSPVALVLRSKAGAAEIKRFMATRHADEPIDITLTKQAMQNDSMYFAASAPQLCFEHEQDGDVRKDGDNIHLILSWVSRHHRVRTVWLLPRLQCASQCRIEPILRSPDQPRCSPSCAAAVVAVRQHLGRRTGTVLASCSPQVWHFEGMCVAVHPPQLHPLASLVFQARTV